MDFFLSFSDVDCISKFAQLEYKSGEPDQGQTMFENILSNYPKRTDIWSIYLDMVIKSGDLKASRLVLIFMPIMWEEFHPYNLLKKCYNLCNSQEGDSWYELCSQENSDTVNLFIAIFSRRYLSYQFSRNIEVCCFEVSFYGNGFC